MNEDLVGKIYTTSGYICLVVGVAKQRCVVFTDNQFFNMNATIVRFCINTETKLS